MWIKNIRKTKTILVVLAFLFVLSISSIYVETPDAGWVYVGEHGIYGDEGRNFLIANTSGAWVINCGGANGGTYSGSKAVWRTDLSTGVSTHIGNLLGDIYQHGMAFDSTNNTMYIMGGALYSGGAIKQSIIWGYNFTNNYCWNTGASMPVTAFKWSRNGVFYNGVAWIFGGYSSHSLGYVIGYCPANNTAWIQHTLGHSGGVRTPGLWYQGSGDICYVVGGADDLTSPGYIDEIRAYCFTNSSDWIAGKYTREKSSSVAGAYISSNNTWLVAPSPTEDTTGCCDLSLLDPNNGWLETKIDTYPNCVGEDCTYADIGVDDRISSNPRYYVFLSICGMNRSIYEYSMTTGTGYLTLLSINGQGNSSTISNLNPTFNWSEIPNAVCYNLQISTSISFTTLTVNITDINDYSYPSEYSCVGGEVSFVLPSSYSLSIGNYYVRVRGYY